MLDQQLELTRLHKALTRIELGRVVIMHPPKLTPLAFPLMVDRLRDRLSSETLAERVARMQADLEAAAGIGMESQSRVAARLVPWQQSPKWSPSVPPHA